MWVTPGKWWFETIDPFTKHVQRLTNRSTFKCEYIWNEQTNGMEWSETRMNGIWKKQREKTKKYTHRDYGSSTTANCPTVQSETAIGCKMECFVSCQSPYASYDINTYTRRYLLQLYICTQCCRRLLHTYIFVFYAWFWRDLAQ